jgi:hypothetical protein
LEGIDETLLPQQEATKKARDKGLTVPEAFAGLLIFDVMSLAVVKHMFPEHPFKKITEFTEALPFATSAKHTFAANFFRSKQADVVLLQEASHIEQNDMIAEDYMRPLSGKDEFTAVLIRKGTLSQVENISATIHAKMTRALEK